MELDKLVCSGCALQAASNKVVHVPKRQRSAKQCMLFPGLFEGWGRFVDRDQHDFYLARSIHHRDVLLSTLLAGPIA